MTFDDDRARELIGRLATRAEEVADQLGNIGRAANFVVLTRDETNNLIDKLEALADALRELQELGDDAELDDDNGQQQED